eukprot:5473678-Amphidinium_carterae.1
MRNSYPTKGLEPKWQRQKLKGRSLEAEWLRNSKNNNNRHLYFEVIGFERKVLEVLSAQESTKAQSHSQEQYQFANRPRMLADRRSSLLASLNELQDLHY